MIILGIETSCDETAAAVLEVKNSKFRVLSNKVSSSVKLQAKYGGIVPEVAARKQIEYIIPVLEQALKQGISNFQPACQSAGASRRLADRFPISKHIDYIAVTNGPGLITSLRVGVEAAKTLSYVWGKKIVSVNHLEGHIYSAELSNFQITSSKFQNLYKIKFPALALIVSGGHTQLVLIKDYLKYRIAGETQDDAVGEAFDKVARILGLGYPGGPVISKLAKKGDADKIEMPRPMLNSGDYNFSFSGIKTAVLYKTKKQKNKKIKKQFIYNTCASFQEACVDVLVAKTYKAAKEYRVRSIILGGGVAANKRLRGRLVEEIEDGSKSSKMKLFIPDISLTGDNALMIALAGYYKIRKKKFSNFKKIKVDPNLKL